jgi:SAM-dependent methyltransferase
MKYLSEGLFCYTESMSKSWGKYYENTKVLQPSKFLVEALDSFKPQSGKAIDLGCGAGRDTRYLLEKGFQVSAVDKDPSAENYLKQLPHHDNLKFTCASFEDYEYDRYELVNAHYALPFIQKEYFDTVMSKILKSIKPKGLFVGQLFGVNDEWNTPDAKMTFCERAEVEILFRNFKHLKIKEVNEEGAMASGGAKHWHVFNIIAQK